MKKINSIEEFNQLAESDDLFFLVKHSLTCPISHAAFEEYNKFTGSTDVPCYYLAVQDSRPLSNHIAEKFMIRHESPQALLFSSSTPVWHASHWKITHQSLEEALTQNR